MQEAETIIREPDVPDRMIDVVEAFDCPCQTRTYVDAYRAWRRRKKNRYAFAFTKHPKEASFAENRAVVNDSPTQAEKSALYRVSMLIGCVLIGYLVLENVFDKLLVAVLGSFGYHIELLYWGESRLYGDESVVFLVTVLVSVVKYLVPAALLMAILRLPLPVVLPAKFVHKSPVLYGVALTMIVSDVFGMLIADYSSEMNKYRLISDAVSINDHRIIQYILFSVFGLPFLAELLLHGAMFQLLRQFGDSFAVLCCSLTAALLTHNVLDAVRMGLMYLLISRFMLQSGSFLTALLLRFIHEIYMFGLYYISTFGQAYSLQWWITTLLPVGIGLIAGCIYLTKRRKPRPELRREGNTYLNLYDRFSTWLSAFPTTAFVITSMILLVVNAILEA